MDPNSRPPRQGDIRKVDGRYQAFDGEVWHVAAPVEPPAWDPDVEQALDAIGEQVGAAVTPLAATLQETRQALVRMTPLYADLHDTLEAVLDVTTRAGVNPSWVQDREILDHARDLIARTAPNGAPDADPTPDPATPAR